MAKKYYAYLLEDSGKSGIYDNWAQCKDLVTGKNARYKGFPTRKEAEEWLKKGAKYEPKKEQINKIVNSIIKEKSKSGLDKEADSKKFLKQNTLIPLKPGIYFDAGTGRGLGVEASVTDEKGNNLLDKIISKDQLNHHGKYLIKEKVTNNYGELLACFFALQIAMALGKTEIFGDSELIIKYWSKGQANIKDKRTVELIGYVTTLRKEFEKKKGRIEFVSGDVNPADLGFHR